MGLREIRKKYRSSFKGAMSRRTEFARRRAKEENITCSITTADITLKWQQCRGFCELCEEPMRLSGQVGDQDVMSLDKIIPELGYTPDNCALLCMRCNNIKSKVTPEFMKKLLAFIEKRQLRLVG